MTTERRNSGDFKHVRTFQISSFALRFWRLSFRVSAILSLIVLVDIGSLKIVY
jgi:hypothetical protein